MGTALEPRSWYTLQMGRATRHIRRWNPSPVRGRWQLKCDCGWCGEISAFDGPRQIPRGEADKQLEQMFLGHIPEARRQTYVLVDQRAMAAGDPVEGEPDSPVGNFIMPEGKPCRLVAWWESDGVYQGRVKGFDFEDPELELPIGEIRTANGQVFRLG